MTKAAEQKEPTAAELTEQLAALKKQTEKDPRLAKVIDLRNRIVGLRHSGKAASDPEVGKLLAERDALKAEVFAPVEELSARRGAALRAERDVAAHMAAEELRKLDTAKLSLLLAEIGSAQRLLKAKKRALRVVLDERSRKKATEDLVKKMSPAERAEMLAMLEEERAGEEEP